MLRRLTPANSALFYCIVAAQWPIITVRQASIQSKTARRTSSQLWKKKKKKKKKIFISLKNVNNSWIQNVFSYRPTCSYFMGWLISSG